MSFNGIMLQWIRLRPGVERWKIGGDGTNSGQRQLEGWGDRPRHRCFNAVLFSRLSFIDTFRWKGTRSQSIKLELSEESLANPCVWGLVSWWVLCQPVHNCTFYYFNIISFLATDQVKWNVKASLYLPARVSTGSHLFLALLSEMCVRSDVPWAAFNLVTGATIWWFG